MYLMASRTCDALQVNLGCLVLPAVMRLFVLQSLVCLEVEQFS